MQFKIKFCFDDEFKKMFECLEKLDTEFHEMFVLTFPFVMEYAVPTKDIDDKGYLLHLIKLNTKIFDHFAKHTDPLFTSDPMFVREAFRANPKIIKYISDQSILQVSDIDDIFESISDGCDRDDRMILEDLAMHVNKSMKPDTMKHVQLAIVKRYAILIREFQVPVDDDVILCALQADGCAIQYINDPSDEFKMEAVKTDGTAVRFISNPSQDIIIEAVKQTPEALQFVHQIENVKWTALRVSHRAIHFINNPSDEMKVFAVEKFTEQALQIRQLTREMFASFEKILNL